MVRAEQLVFPHSLAAAARACAQIFTYATRAVAPARSRGSWHSALGRSIPERQTPQRISRGCCCLPSHGAAARPLMTHPIRTRLRLPSDPPRHATPAAIREELFHPRLCDQICAAAGGGGAHRSPFYSTPRSACPTHAGHHPRCAQVDTELLQDATRREATQQKSGK